MISNVKFCLNFLCKGVIRKQYERLYATKLENLELDKLLESYYLPILNHEEIENLSRPINFSKEIETAPKTSQETKPKTR